MNTRWLSAALAAIAFQSCELTDSRTADRGTNDETSSFVLDDGQKASNATVTVFPAGGIDTLPTMVAYTNSKGEVKLSSLPRGYYSLLVSDKSGHASFVDSVYSDGANVNLPSDTLRPTGSIKGRIKVQVQDDPRIAWVALVGEGNFHTIDNDSGTFVLTGIAAGKHTLVSRTDFSEYTSTFRTASVFPDSVTDLGTIELVYSGMPIVTGIVGEWDSLGGIVDVKWDASTSTKVKGYRVYRSTSNDPLGETLLGFVDSGTTTFSDTVFRKNPMDWSSKGLIVDTTYVRYRVTTIGQNSAEGDKWNAWADTLRRPYMVAQLPATWTFVSSGLPRGARRLDTLNGSLIAFGHLSDSLLAAWKSSDQGRSWTLLRSEPITATYLSEGLNAAVSVSGEIRWTRPVTSGRKTPHPYLGNQYYTLIDSFLVYSMDQLGNTDSSTVSAADDSVTASVLVVDSAGLVLMEGTEIVSPVTSQSGYHSKHRRLESQDGQWIPGEGAKWFPDGFSYIWGTPFGHFQTWGRHVSITGKVTIRQDISSGTLLDLDSLVLSAASDLSYSRPAAPSAPHKVQGGPGNLTSIAWFRNKIFVLGEGTLWNVALP